MKRDEAAYKALLSLEREIKISTDVAQRRLDRAERWGREQSFANGEFNTYCRVLYLLQKRIKKVSR